MSSNDQSMGNNEQQNTSSQPPLSPPSSRPITPIDSSPQSPYQNTNNKDVVMDPPSVDNNNNNENDNNADAELSVRSSPSSVISNKRPKVDQRRDGGNSTTESSSESPVYISAPNGDQDYKSSDSFELVENNDTENTNSDMTQEERVSLINNLLESDVNEVGKKYFVIPGEWWSTFFINVQEPGILDTNKLIDNNGWIDPNTSAFPVPEHVWDLLIKWYGLKGEPISRYTIDCDGQTLVEINRPVISCRLLDGYGGFPSSTTFFNNQTVSMSVKEPLEKIVDYLDLEINVEDCPPIKLWKVNDNQHSYLNYTTATKITSSQFHSLEVKLIDDTSKNLEELQFGQTNFIIIEFKGTNGWVSDIPPLRGITGLSNLGNTCYMNSALQCLMHVEELACYFLSQDFKNDLNTNNPIGYGGQVAKVFGELLEQVYSNKFSGSFTPRHFKSVIGRHGSAFSGYQQQDSQEFLAFLLDGLHEDLNRIKNKPATEKPELPDEKVNDPEAQAELAQSCWDLHKKRNESVILDLFAGLYRSVLVCPVCKKVSITFDPFFDLTLPLPVDNTWIKQVAIIPAADKLEPPIDFKVAMDGHGTIGDLKEYIAKHRDLDKELLVSVEKYNGRFYTLHEDDEIVTAKINSRDQVFIFELDRQVDTEESDSPFMVPVYHRHKTLKNNSNSNSNVPGRLDRGGSYFGDPFFITLTPEEAKNEQLIYRKVQAGYLHMMGKSDADWDQYSDQVIFEMNYFQPRFNAKNAAIGFNMISSGIKPFAQRKPLQQGENDNDAQMDEDEQQQETPDVTASGNTTPSNASSDEDQNNGKWASSSSNNLKPILLDSDDDENNQTSDRVDSGVTSDNNDSMHVDNNTEEEDEEEDNEKEEQLNEEELSTATEPPVQGPFVFENEGLVIDWTRENIESFLGDDNFTSDREYVLNDDLLELQKQADERKRRGIYLSDCLDLFSKPEVLGEDDVWYCSKCQELRQATKTIDIWKVPEIFTVHLKRFSSFRSFSDKIDDVVQFPIEGLDMTERVGDIKQKEQGMIYDLFAVDNHYGGLGGGHYTAYAKNFVNNKWYTFDDSRVTETEPENVITGAAYLLFYRRRSTQPLGNEEVKGYVEKMRGNSYEPVVSDISPSYTPLSTASSVTPGAGYDSSSSFKGHGNVLGSSDNTSTSSMSNPLPWGEAKLNLGGVGRSEEIKNNSDGASGSSSPISTKTNDRDDDSDYIDDDDDDDDEEMEENGDGGNDAN